MCSITSGEQIPRWHKIGNRLSVTVQLHAIEAGGFMQ